MTIPVPPVAESRVLFAVASRPEVVSLAGGMPTLAALPLDTLAAEVVLAEEPSYVGALGSFAAYEADVRHVAMDDDALVARGARGEPGRAERRGPTREARTDATSTPEDGCTCSR